MPTPRGLSRGITTTTGTTPSGQLYLSVAVDGERVGLAWQLSAGFVVGNRKAVPTRQDAIAQILEREVARARRRLRRLLELREG